MTNQQTLSQFLKSKIHEQKKKFQTEAIFVNKLKGDDGSIRQIIRGDRIPADKNPILKSMAELLDVEEQTLLLCCIESRRQKRENSPSRNKPKKSVTNYKQVDNGIEPLTEGEAPPTNFNISNSLPKQKYATIEGSKKLACAIISILKKIEKHDSGSNRVLLTFQSRDSLFGSDLALEREYQKSLVEALEKGWNIEHLIRLDSKHKQRTYEIVANSTRFFGQKGKYIPQYFQAKSVLTPPYGLLILPGKEALISLATNQPFYTDSAIYTKDQKQLAILESHFEQLQKQSEFIFQSYENYEQKKFVEALQEVDPEPGARIILTRRMSEITRPIEWYNNNSSWVKQLMNYLTKSSPDTDFSNHIAHRKLRAETLQNHLEKGKDFYRYIYPKSCLETFANQGKTFVDKSGTIPYYFEAKPDERIQQFNKIIDLLNYEKYQMALLDDETDTKLFSQMKPSFCEVQGHHAVLMEFWTKNENGTGSSQWFFCNERVVASAFQDRFSELWNNIPDKCKDKEDIICWIKSKIRKLEE